MIKRHKEIRRRRHRKEKARKARKPAVYGRGLFVDATADLLHWIPLQDVTSTNPVQSLLVSSSAPLQFYRLRFPFSWSWP